MAGLPLNRLAVRLGCCGAVLLGAALLTAGGAARAQITINSKTGEVTNNSTGEVITTIDRRYAQVQPTHVALSDTRLDPKTRILLMREMTAEHGFAMRPLPLGHTGLTLEANGGLNPAGQAYLDLVNSNGVSSKPGSPVMITDVKIEGNKMIFMLNGGPDLKHRFLRHIELGGTSGPDGSDGVPIIEDGMAANGQEGTGSRLTLTFKGQVPELTSMDVKALLAPLISFSVKSPVEAFTDTLPTPLKNAILAHQVWVGMTTDMVLFAKGHPDNKLRETEGQLPFEEWIYGKPPEEVDFVRINGNRVIRVEVAKPGVEMAIYTQDQVSGLMDVSALQPPGNVVKLGDDVRDPARESPKAPPTLRNPGEGLAPGAPAMQRQTAEKPVRFPKQDDQDQPWNTPDGVQEQTPQKGQQGAQSQPTGAQPNGQSAPASGQQAAPATPGTGSATPAGAGQPQQGTQNAHSLVQQWVEGPRKQTDSLNP